MVETHRRIIDRVPLALTALRALLAPVLVLLACCWPSRVAFAACLVLGFLSDLFDGIIARRLGIATAELRRLDSAADTLFHLAALFAAWHLHESEIRAVAKPLAALAALELTRYAYDWLKFRREASYHMWSSKLWGLALFAGFLALLAGNVGGGPVALAAYVGIAADLEGLAISATLRNWRADVPTLLHAFEIRKGQA
ncbi:MAG: CDP-alcohol phosphatidyltransferase family protein [Burkholderiales bacterium]|nr:CDP-alcohol phosphatidyltransferase family protein [Burkholderiales bacterium]